MTQFYYVGFTTVLFPFSYSILHMGQLSSREARHRRVTSGGADDDYIRRKKTGRKPLCAECPRDGSSHRPLERARAERQPFGIRIAKRRRPFAEHSSPVPALFPGRSGSSPRQQGAGERPPSSLSKRARALCLPRSPRADESRVQSGAHLSLSSPCSLPTALVVAESLRNAGRGVLRH